MMDINIQELLHKKGDLTDEEYDALDEYYTVNTVMPAGGRLGYFAENYGMPIYLDAETTGKLRICAEAAHKTPAEIISEMVREKIAASA
jgi:hypothetical protein